MTGRIFEAEEAKQIGLLNHVAPADQLEAKTTELVDMMLSKAPIALGLVKRVAWNASNVDASTARIFETMGQSILISTDDHKEGLAAFRGKRKAKFSGR
jgi:enoyl-CoA hydratase